jgi:hypothetical protein
MGVLVGVAIRSTKQGFGATDSLDARFAEKQARAKSGLISNHAVPALADLLSDVTEQLPPWAVTQTTSGELGALMQDELQSFDYVSRLKALGELATDHESIDSLFGAAEQWGFVRGCSSLLLIPILVFFAVWMLIGGWDPPVWLLVLAALVGLVAFIAASLSWGADIVYRRRLVKVCRRYAT